MKCFSLNQKTAGMNISSLKNNTIVGFLFKFV